MWTMSHNVSDVLAYINLLRRHELRSVLTYFHTLEANLVSGVKTSVQSNHPDPPFELDFSNFLYYYTIE